MFIRRVVGLCIAVFLVAGASLSLVAQDKKKEPKKLSKQEQQDIATLVKLADGIGMDQTAPADLTLTWQQNHFLKASDGNTFMPYTVIIDAKGLSSPGVAMYVRAVAKSAPAAAADKKGDKKGDQEKIKYPWDDIQFFDVPANGHVSRAIAVPGGDYDLIVAVKKKSTGKEKKNDVNKTGVLRRELAVPGFGKPELDTSSVILADVVEASPPLDPDGQRANPYVFGNMRITPNVDPKFKKSAELNLVFWIYGVSPASAQKPDVLVDYNFHQKLPDGEKFFNRTAPQPLNGQTLDPAFDMSIGHLLMGSLTVPLASFPPGDYRLEIKITDKPSGKTLTRNVAFSVVA